MDDVAMTTPESNLHDRRYVILVIAVMALVIRISSRLYAGVSLGVDFDEGAYLSVASWIGRGAVPYRDAAAAHPPGMFLLYAPLTWLGSPTTSIVVLRFASMVIGSVSTWVVGDTVRRHRSLEGGVVAAVVYAVLPAALAVERSILVEPVLTLLMLVAARAWLLSAEGDANDRRSGRLSGPVVAGLAWGLAVFCKLTAVVLAVPIAVTSLVRRCPRRGFVTGLVALGALGVVLAPFVVLAGRPMFEQVMVFQFGRGPGGMPAPERYSWIWGFGGELSALRSLAASSVVVVGLGVFLVDCRRRVVDELLVFGLAWYATCATMIATSWVYYPHYNALLAPGVALVAGLLGHRFAERVHVTPRVGVGLIIGFVALMAIALPFVFQSDARYPAEAAEEQRLVASAVRRHDGCLWSWEPRYLVMGDRLPDIDRFGAAASEPGVAEIGAALADNEPGAELGGYRTVSRAAIAQCPFVLATADEMRGLSTTHHVIEDTYPGGPQIWKRRDPGG